MSFNSRLVTVIFCSSFFVLTAAFGQKAAIEADVKGVDGRPSKGAEVRIERVDKKTQPVIAKTDGRGHLAANNLEAGTYKLTATVEGGVQSTLMVKTQANKPLLVTFDMRKTAAVTGKKAKRYVWVASETGTRLGGHWVEVGQDGQRTDPSTRNLDMMNGNAMNNLQRQSFGSAPRAGGGQ
jgi:hypothetical protein